MVPFNIKHTSLKFLVIEAFYHATSVTIGILLVNEEPEVLGLETHMVLRELYRGVRMEMLS